MTATEKQKAIYHAHVYITKVLKTKTLFMDFDYVYGSGVLFRGLTREEVEEIYNSLKK